MASKIDPLHDSLSHLDLKPGYTHTLHVLKTYVGSESKKEGFICDLLTDKHPSNLKKKPSFGFIVLLQADWRKADTVFFFIPYYSTFETSEERGSFVEGRA